ncbi:MAG: sulfatase-like hydrolase/transferase, partial [Anaerolineae bacterium]|nr:sulfatase-like hydrolase/transferase [Anaerolineae bacterium]
MKPNILIIITDQLSAGALSVYGNAWNPTLNIDRILNRGVLFDHAYTNCPLCQPA